MPTLDIRNLGVRYASKAGTVDALSNVNLAVRDGDFVVAIGASGCGKTTLLSCIAGFLPPTEGTITLDGKPVIGPGADRGVVFQKHALMPWLNVISNVEFGLRMRGVAPDERRRIAMEKLSLVGLEEFADRAIYELSGGMQQRVGMARALASNPELLLMDEPLGALDRELRIRMAAELRRIHRELSTTIVYVTHDREEAMTLSDRIAIMHRGELEAVDTPQHLYTRPTSRFVASFFAGHNLIPARLITTNGNQAEVECLKQRVQVEMGASLQVSADAWLAVPSQAIGLERHGDSDLTLTGRTVEALYLGEVVQLTCTVEGVGPVQATLPYRGADRLDVDTELRLHVDTMRVVAVSQTPTHRTGDRGGNA